MEGNFYAVRTEEAGTSPLGSVRLWRHSQAAQSVEPAGAVFAHHFAIDPKTFDFEVGVPVARSITAAGRVELGERPDVRVAQTIYHGAYQGLPDAWGKFHAWIEENGHDLAPDVWETYVDGPHSNPDPTKWRTELSRPLRRGRITDVIPSHALILVRIVATM